MKGQADRGLVNLRLAINKTIEDLKYARIAESNADPEFIESAILQTNALRVKLNSLYEILHREYPDL